MEYEEGLSKEEALLMCTHNICYYEKLRKNIPELSPNNPSQ